MSVWHLSGLGLNPGALTIPLTYIYMALKCESIGDDNAKKFFEYSGEYSQNLKGVPEYIIIFTSKDVINGNKQNDVEDKWFYVKKQKNISETISKYLTKLLEALKDDNFFEFYNDNWIKDIFFVEVNHENFDDCYYKIGVTMKALEEKEVWVNMIGGTNQINLSLLISGSLFGIPFKYYYIFQLNQKLLHPDIDRPDFKNPKRIMDIISKKWQEIPIFQLDLGELIKELEIKFSDRVIINIKEIEALLSSYGYPKIYISKLRNGLLTIINNEEVSKGPLFDKVSKMINKIKQENINNFSEWKEWAKKHRILWKFNLKENLQEVS